jgi:hypothetical protein
LGAQLDAAQFIKTWKGRDGREIENSQTFLNDLCDVLGVPKPHQVEDRLEYGFERPVTFHHANATTSTGRIDLYKRGSFVLEAKQGSEQKARPADPRQHELITGQVLGTSPRGMADRNTPAWGAAMLKAHGQAYAYARALESSEGWPPFLIVVDIGHVFHVYADFSGAGKNYAPFPDGTKYRIHMDDLAEAGIRARLKAIWDNPLSLDPTRHAARVTRQIAAELAELGKSFEAQKHQPEAVAKFLMRCLFTMFAEDVELIPDKSFTKLLAEFRDHPQHVQPTLQALWTSMNTGGFSSVLKRDVLHFNGGLFADASALPVNNLQLGLLIRAAEHDWKLVEPAIFGTLMERALSPKERHRLGAHFTPRAYVERLVGPTILEPLRADWLDVQAAALKLHAEGKNNEAIDTIREFKRSLCNIRVLDPACGSGNFLYVALEGMKRLEGEVSETLKALGDTQIDAFTVDPHQFLGIEKNPWAAQVAELVLWIGYLQWHFRTFGKAAPSQPVLRDFHNIECRDALLDLKGERPRVDENGKPVTRWDGESYVTHPVTGERVPDPQARIQVMDFEEANAAQWPTADFIVGNPPFIGNKRMREALGDGYAEALWTAYPKTLQSADFVLFWWQKAALLTRSNGKSNSAVRQFGFITTNSLRQTFNRRVLEEYLSDKKKPLSIVFAIPDHPWVDAKDGAAVRIAMTVATGISRGGRLLLLASEFASSDESEGKLVDFVERRGRIFANLQTGADVSAARALEANKDLAWMGIIPLGLDGFLISKEQAHQLGYVEPFSSVIRAYMGGSDLVDGNTARLIVDLFGMSFEQARAGHPQLVQKLYDEVKPFRDKSERKSYRENWWFFGEPRPAMRLALSGLQRFVATTETAKHRAFSFVPSAVLPDQKIRVISCDDAAVLAILSSRLHVSWTNAACGYNGVGNDSVYNTTDCFDPFPFPDASPAQTRTLRDRGEQLDAHRKARQKEHPKLTLTQMYNVLEKLRAGETIEGRDKEIYDQGLIGILKDIHDRIDAAAADAYGWPVDLSDEEILERLVALNRERKLEEAAGKVRWLRPDYQNPGGGSRAPTASGDLELPDEVAEEGKVHWPSALPVQVAFVRSALTDIGEGTVEQVASRFVKAPRKQVEAILQSLAALGRARLVSGGRFAA